MTVKDNCDKWIEYAYENWLNNWVRTLEGNKYLSEAAENMVKRMKDASRNGKTEEAWHLMERLQRMSGTFYGTSENHDLNYHDQWAEIYMECALVAYDLGDLAEASKLLHEATGNFYGNQTLQKAIVYWFLGCIQWQLPAHSEEAVVSWERAMKIVKGAAADIDKEQKCKQVADVMREAINAATLEGSPNSPRNSSEENTANTEAPHRPTRSSANSSSLRLGFLPYYGSIPAGDPVAALKRPEGAARVNSLEINERNYELVNINRSEQEINLARSHDYFLMKVKGDSMNDASPVKIENGDCVLLRDTREAYNGEIVAAVIAGEGSEATLKRYLVEGTDKFLKFENVQDKKKVPLNGKNYYIQGVVVAILKPQ